MPMRTFLATMLFVFCLPGFAVAQEKKKGGEALVVDADDSETDKIYSWVDGRGAWHFVDSLAMVPRGYKSQARRNATRATRARNAAATTPSAAPPTGPTRPDPRVLATEAPMTDGERTMKIRQLQRRLMELESEIAAMEEGSVPRSYEKAVESDDQLTDAKLDELLSQTEDEIDRIKVEIEALSE